MLPSPFLYADKVFYLHLIVKSAICLLNVYNKKTAVISLLTQGAFSKS